MSNTGLLIVTNPTKVSRILPIIQQNYVNKTLYVQYYPNRQRLLVPSNIESSAIGPLHGKHIVAFYTLTNSLCPNLDVRVLLRQTKDPLFNIINTEKPIDIVIFDRLFHKDDISVFMSNCLRNKGEQCKSVTIETEKEEVQLDVAEAKYYDQVVLGGTFDQLHPGHKILLSEAALRCSDKLTVGVTDTEMLFSKTLWELIAPCADRMMLVRRFLQDIEPAIEYNIVPITDPFGPTKDEPELQLIVVSSETFKGGEAVNALRRKNHLPSLDVHVVELLTSGHRDKDENDEDKASSSNLRLRLLGRRIREPQSRENLPPKPYLIGLTGGIGSGKSTIAQFLTTLGAGHVNCDNVAHDLYLPGQPVYHRVVGEFGPGIIDDNTGLINRKILAGVVFGSVKRMNKLNSLVWPSLLYQTKIEIQKLYDAGKTIIVVEAAVILQAGWMEHCHEVWTCIIPPNEAIRRLHTRNNLSEKEARRRLNAQPSNSDQVSIANVVFCSLWTVEYTQKQVMRAWNALQDDLRESKL